MNKSRPGRPNKKPINRKNDPTRLNETSEMLARVTEQAIQRELDNCKSGYTTTGQMSAFFNVTIPYFKYWAKTKKIRRYKELYNLYDICSVLMPAVRSVETRADILGDWSKWGTTFSLGDYSVFEHEDTTPIYISSKPQSDGSVLWAVTAYVDPCWCLTKQLEWVYEPEPAKRKIAYLRMTRYQTKEDALDSFVRFWESVKMIGEYDLNNLKIEP